MRKYQIWIHGNVLVGHVNAKSKTEAMRHSREMVRSEFPDDKRPCVFVCPISPDYYRKIAESNKRQGFGVNAGD